MEIWNILVCVWIGVIHGALQVNSELVLTSSPVTATDGERFTLICRSSSGSAVNIVWLQNNTSKVITQLTNICTKQPPPITNNIDRFRESCNVRVHSIAFRFNSTTDQGGWQCGKLVNDTYIYPRSNIYHIVMASLHMSTLSTSTLKIETTSGTVTPQKASTDDNDSDTIYIVVGAVGGGVLLAVVVAGIVYIQRRRQAAHQKEDMKGKRKTEATPDDQNRTSCHTIENDLYIKARGISPIHQAENLDDFVMSDAYASVDMAAANTHTLREQGASCDVDVDNLHAKPDKSRTSNVQQVSDIYAEVKKPKKRRQDYPKVSEDVNTGDLYAKPNKG